MHDYRLLLLTGQNIIRVLFVDFSKAFDVIDHNVLLNKFISDNIPEHIIVWSLDFLNGRKQFVKINNSVSNTTVVGAGTPQGTVSSPNDFKLVINDLTFNMCYAKYVDDTTVLSVSKDMKTKKTQYWSTRLCNEGNNPRLLWRSLDSILRCKACGLPTAPVAHSADDFQHFFQDKVNGVRAATDDHSQATGSQPPLVAGSSLPSMTMWR